ncbi:hypothetical protein [Paracoccus broussonetiae]|uniref:Uncharacterized protein n=1 Tax=Paracoccus broussonetiae subsp. drimophilus TaxID=3373869 RepID=A0ABW7LNS2_9RHOB
MGTGVRHALLTVTSLLLADGAAALPGPEGDMPSLHVRCVAVQQALDAGFATLQDRTFVNSTGASYSLGNPVGPHLEVAPEDEDILARLTERLTPAAIEYVQATVVPAIENEPARPLSGGGRDFIQLFLNCKETLGSSR